MPSLVRNILGVIAGFVLGSIVNMGLIMTGQSVIKLPHGADITNAERLKTSMHLFEPRHFLFPFLAHALGTFVGAYIAARISAYRKMMMAIIVGILFLAGGIMNVVMLPSPLWFTILDLIVAYLPMAYVAGKLASR